MTTSFFVPAATQEEQEEIYAEFARWCRCPVPAPDKRIFKITYNHDGTSWTAAVGETLRGERIKVTRSRGQANERTLKESDPATVLAIFAGIPYMVVTNEGLGGTVGSRWVNPFLAGKPVSVTYFASSTEGSD